MNFTISTGTEHSFMLESGVIVCCVSKAFPVSNSMILLFEIEFAERHHTRMVRVLGVSDDLRGVRCAK